MSLTRLMTDRAAGLSVAAAPQRFGRVTGVVGLGVEVSGLDAAVGEMVLIHTGDGSAAGPERVPAEVVAISAGSLRCLPMTGTAGLRVGSAVSASGGPLMVPIGPSLLGRVIDAFGRPLDGRPLPPGLTMVPTEGTPPPALQRQLVDTPVQTGVRVLDTMVPLGRGQRIGVFAGSGVGKSSLLSMVARGTSADVSVLALVGERGREVREFIENDLGPEGLARSVVVIATSDEPPLARLRAAATATRIAESFRDSGQDVLLMMDSLTRVAMAQREVGLSAGEPPATRGYPPSVFALLPRLLERAGPAPVGSITGVYTVLVDGGDHDEPIADAARSILDGHVVLDRSLATAGHFPTVDVLGSVSRVVGAVTTPEQRASATVLRRVMAAHREARTLIEVGAYASGTSPDVDAAIRLMPQINGFLRQDLAQSTDASVAWQQLAGLAARLEGAG